MSPFCSHLEDERMASKVPGFDADSEQSECSTDLRKHHLHDHYQRDTAGKKMDKERCSESGFQPQNKVPTEFKWMVN